jgi:hypothetical protein
MSAAAAARPDSGVARHTALQAERFRHVSAEKAPLYRSVMACFAAAKRQFRLHLRPDEVLAEGRWELPAGQAPRLEEIQLALAKLTEWGSPWRRPCATMACRSPKRRLRTN